MKNLPNMITLLRLLSAPVIFYFLATSKAIAAFVLALTAFVSDWIDGYLARKMGTVSRFGELADPLADRLLVLSVLAGQVFGGKLPAIIFFLVVLRELIAVAGFLIVRNFLAPEFRVIREGKIIAAVVYVFLTASIIIDFPDELFWLLVCFYYLAFVFYLKSIKETQKLGGKQK